MKQRCYYKSHKSYSEYGGRGIHVCDDWRNSYEAFRKWSFQNGYQSDLTLERKNVDGDYTPMNCCWVSSKAQANNRRNNHKVSFNGTDKTLAEWSETTGVQTSTIRYRLKAGWSVERAITKGATKNENGS